LNIRSLLDQTREEKGAGKPKTISRNPQVFFTHQLLNKIVIAKICLHTYRISSLWDPPAERLITIGEDSLTAIME
jgi:hypothetical protein